MLRPVTAMKNAVRSEHCHRVLRRCSLLGQLRIWRTVGEYVLMLLMVSPLLYAFSLPKGGRNENLVDRSELGVPFLHLCALSVYKQEDQYLITVYEDGAIRKTCTFTPERVCTDVQGMTLIEDQPVERFVGVDINTVQTLLGKPHADIGSGFYIPAYITEDAYLIYFQFEGNEVFGVFKEDLLTGTMTGRVWSP